MRKIVSHTILLLLVVALFPVAVAAQVDLARLSRVDSLVNKAIADKAIPGAVLAVVHKDSLVYLKAYGNKSVYPTVEPMTTETVFDLASVTKPFTAIAIMQLVEQGKIRLDDAASRYLPYVPKDIKVIHLLTHTSGIADYSNLAKLLKASGKQNRKALEEYIVQKSGRSKVGTVFEYSCLNYVLLQYIVEKVLGKSLRVYEQEHIFKPLGMAKTDFNPEGELLKLCAPTERMLDGSVLCGVVHDSLARDCNNGISGNAGLFSNAEDLVKLSKALMNGGELNGKRILGTRACELMRTVPVGFEKFGRSLGWDSYSTYASDRGDLFGKPKTFGHTGYTGPNLFIDPVSQTAVIFLAHRVHPDNVGSLVSFRAKLANIVAGAIVGR